MVSSWVNFVTLVHAHHCETNNELAMISNSISTIDWPNTSLSHLQFIPAIPPPNVVPLQPDSLQSSPNTRSTPPERGMMFLTSSSIDFQDCRWFLILTFCYSTLQLDSKLPSSVLTLYAVAPRVLSNVPNSRNIAWVHTIILIFSINLMLVYRQ